MIGEVAFKGFCSHANDGLPIRALFITPNAPSREEQKIDMLNMASARGLDALYYHKERTLAIGPATVYQRIAHPYLDRELKSLEWHFIHGLEYLNAFDEGDAIAANLTMMVRL